MKSLWSCFSLLFLVFGVPAVVRGDVAPSFLTNESFPAMRFDNLADYPQYDFYLKYAHGPGNPYASPHVTRIPPSGVLRTFEGTGRTGDAFLLAVPQGRPAPLPGQHEDFWSKPLPPGCLQSGRLEGAYLGAGHLVPYRVLIDDDKLEVTMLPSEQQPGVTAAYPWLRYVPWIAVALAFSVALAWLGVRLARRLFRAKPVSPPA